MSKPFDSPSNDAAYNYAFVLALSQHLAQVETKFNALPAEDFQSLEETLWAQDLSTNLHLVREYGLKKIAEHFRTQDLAANCPQGQYRQALSYNLEELLLGPRVRRTAATTDHILAKIDDPAPFTGVLLHTAQLSKKLGVSLTHATKVVIGSPTETAPVFTATSHVLAHYLDHAAAELSAQVDLGALSMQIESATAHLKLESLASVDHQAVFTIFKAMVASQLEVASTTVDDSESTSHAVLRLRELGNNLTNLSSYPQAVKVYTEALDLCDWTCSNNIPQLYTNRAILFIGLNCFEEAVSDLNNAITYDRSFTPALAQLGYCHLYLGSGLLALSCYVVALRSVAGEIYPDNFPEDQELRAQYTNNKVLTVVPQFVQKLVQSIILSEKRATQQRHPATAIQEQTTRTRAILARLRAAAAPEDLSYFSYSMENSMESVRATAARSNRMRPSILTPEVAQDIMASTNVEASAIRMPVMTFNRPANAANANRNTGTNNAAGEESQTNDNAAATNAGSTEAQPNPPTAEFNIGEDGIRNMLNNIGEAFGDMVQAQTQEFFSQQNGDQAATPQNIGTQQTQGDPQATNVGENQNETPAEPNANTGNANNEANADSEASANSEGIANASASSTTNGANLSERAPAEPAQEGGNSQAAASFRNSFSSFNPDIRGNLGNVISQALRHHQQVTRNMNAQRGGPNPSNAPPANVTVHQGGSPAGAPVVRRVVHQPGQPGPFPPNRTAGPPNRTTVRIPGAFQPGTTQARRVVRVTPRAAPPQQARVVQLSVTAEEISNTPEPSEITPESSRALSSQPDTEMPDAPDLD